MRIVYRDYTSSFECLLKKNGSVRVHHRNIQLVAVEMFKVKNNLCSKMMKELFKLKLKPVNGRDFHIPYVKTEFMGKLSLRWFGPVVWNTMLPDSYKSILSLEKFKDAIIKWIPEKCPCRLCKKYVAGVGFIETFE